MDEDGADPWLWLEDRTADPALSWVEAQNTRTVAALQSDPAYPALFDTALGLLTAEDNIAIGTATAGWVYNFWQDRLNPLGLWRRTSVASYRTATPEWETVLDFDALAAAEGVRWVFSGAERLYPDFTRALVSLSPDGGDAAEVREFDLETKAFVPGGFTAPASKSHYDWLDADTLLVASAHAEADRTASGYPRRVRLWRRGTPVDAAEPLFAVEHDDLLASVGVARDGRRGAHVLLTRVIDFYTARAFLWHPAHPCRHIPLPDDAVQTCLFQGQLVFGVRTPWTAPDGTECAPDGLYSVDFDAWVASDTLGPVETLLAPRPRVSVAGLARTEGRLFIQLLDNVRGRVIAADRSAVAGWQTTPLALPDNGNIGLSHVDPHGTSVSFTFTDFLTPLSLVWSDDEGRTLATIKAQPARFDTSGLLAEQHEATAPDGTRIPYFVVRPKGQGAPLPTLLYAYGGFQVPLVPGYSGLRGRLWMEPGNVYVQACIRGGGEFGPAWHIAALGERRQTAFDDFAAVARDLVARGITTAAQLGIEGGSNGGLLVGTAMTQHAELYGAVVCQVPLLDMLRYTALPPGASWIAEYGDPAVPEAAAWLAAYSPYQNARRDAGYPPILLLTSTADDRVHPGHARKMAARLLDYGHAGTLYYEETEGGHGGRGDQRPLAARTAMRHIFLAHALGARLPTLPPGA